jgi:hypothetical protein
VAFLDVGQSLEGTLDAVSGHPRPKTRIPRANSTPACNREIGMILADDLLMDLDGSPKELDLDVARKGTIRERAVV